MASSAVSQTLARTDLDGSEQEHACWIPATEIIPFFNTGS
jgi:hypothetical protein